MPCPHSNQFGWNGSIGKFVLRDRYLEKAFKVIWKFFSAPSHIGKQCSHFNLA